MGEIDRISSVLATGLQQIKRDRKSPKRLPTDLQRDGGEIEPDVQEELTVSEQDSHIDLSA